MFSWRLLGVSLAPLVAAGLVSLALSAPAALSLSKDAAPLLAATPVVREFAVVTHPAWQLVPATSGNLVVWADSRNGNDDSYGAWLEWPPAPGACSLTGTVRGQSGSYYPEEGGQTLAFLYGESVNFPAYLGQRVTVGGPCRVWREAAGPRPGFLVQTIQLAAGAPGQQPANTKVPKGATRGW